MKNENQILEYLAKEIAQIKSTQYEVGTKINLLYNKFCPESDLLTPKEAEQLTGKKRGTLSRWAKSGKLTIKEGNGNRKYKLTEINQIINK